MKKKSSIILIFTITLIALGASVFFSCNSHTETKASLIKKDTVITLLSKPGATFTDTLIISRPSAVFYNPDSLQLEKIKAVNQRTIFESLTHDCFYQMRNARIVLKKYWPQVTIVDNSRARFLLFIKSDKTQTLIDLDHKNDICGILLFDPAKEPELIDMMNIDTALGFYFKP